ncbi:multicopper oxidase domain-containing protein [Apibacter raozihei]|uniref:multicopper oxidase domain-containing protein n=1 Tax=Apibacter raozihei TaxID=2500547 RepID=UPI000FE3E034|nr:multicopper oxidase domain-containing protein [Apibacter raozihei]
MISKIYKIIPLFFFMSIYQLTAQKTVRYDLTITDTLVNYTGKNKKAFAVNGQIPMPTLRFTEGDTAVIYIHNNLKGKTTSLHWHGILLPNQYDGVDYLTSAPIKAGETVVYKFPIIQNGTYWYHSHTGLQEQDGMYGAFIIDKKDEKITYPEHTVLVTDWTNANSNDVLRRLYFHDDWAEIQKNKIQKGVTQSYLEAIQQGHLGTKIKNEWKRMSAMDVSDVYYDQIQINGKQEDTIKVNHNKRVKLRIINGGSSSYFWVTYSGGKMQVVAADGKDVEPVTVDRFIMGNGETYDVWVEVPDDSMSYELLATTEDRTRTASLWVGNGGHKMPAERLKPLKYFEGMKMMNGMMKMNGNLDPMGMKMGMQKMDMNQVMYPEIKNNSGGHSGHGDHAMGMNMNMEGEDSKNEHSGHTMNHESMHTTTQKNTNPVTLNYSMLKSPVVTTLPEGPVKELRFELTGNMDRYVWSLNNKTISEADKIVIKKGEKVRIVLYNNTMMRHPLHLHGHFFRILNGQGEYSPLKHTLDIMPMETDTIEFEANESGDWIFHCHILYHMMSGMGRVFSYENSPQNPQLPDSAMSWKMFSMMDKMKRFSIQNEFSSGGNTGKLMLENKRWALQSEWKLAYQSDPGYEAEVRLGRYIGKMQWFMPYIGYNWNHTSSEREKNIFGQRQNRQTINDLTIGFRYLLPMLVRLDASVSPTSGQVRVKLEKEDVVVSPRLRMDLSLDDHLEFTTRMRYLLTKYISVSGYYDSEWKWGAGLQFRY